MAVPQIKTSFAAGEVAPSFFGHVDNQHYALGCSTCRNAFISYRGGAYSRAGTAFVGFSKQTNRAFPPRLITFQFNINQGLALEFGHFYMRVIQNGAFVTEAPIAITNITQANPGSIFAANSYSLGDWVFLNGIAGTTQLNGVTGLISTVNSAGFTLVDVYGNPINTNPMGAYAGGGTAARIYTLVTPYAEADLKWLKFAKQANVLKITCWNQQSGALYAPYDLTRIANNNWTIIQTSFGPTIGPPGQPQLALTHPAGSLGTADTSQATYGFVVTAVNPRDGSESIASQPAAVGGTALISATAGSILLNWGGSAGASSYNVYACEPIAGTTTNPPPTFVPAGVLYGFVGTSQGTSFTYGNVFPDFAQTPPLATNPFSPGAVLFGIPTNNGGGYGSPPTTVSIVTSTGTGAVLLPVYDTQNGTVTAVVVVNGGTGYTSSDTWFVPGGAPNATGTITAAPATGTYPSVVSFFQERCVYAGTPNQPDTYFMSQPGAYLNFDSRIPTIDSDAIIGTPWAEEVNGIQALISMPGGLVVLTGLSAWQLTGVGGSSLNPQPITPSNQQAQPQAFNGCHAHVPPDKVNWEVFYVQAKGSLVRAFSYNFFVNIYTGLDLTYLSVHLFQASGAVNSDGIIREWAWAEEPYKVRWVVREDGTMLSLTYFKEQEVAAWARHDTNGLFRSVCTVTEPPVDAVYFATQRFIASGSSPTYMIERMDNRLWNGIETTWCVDAGLSLPLPMPNTFLGAVAASGNGVVFGAGAPGVFSPGSVGQILRMGGGVATITQYVNSTTVVANITTPIAELFPNGQPVPQPPGNWSISPLVTRITGLRHLLGLPVTGIADGVAIPPQVVGAFSDGTYGITLATPASAVTVGLGFQAQVQSLYLDAGSPTAQGRRKKIAKAVVRLEASLGVKIGANQPDGSVQSPRQLAPQWSGLSIVPEKGPSYPTAGGATVQELWTGDSQNQPIAGGFAVPGQVCVQQDNPYPMQVLAFIPEILPGDIPEVEARPSERQMRRTA